MKRISIVLAVLVLGVVFLFSCGDKGSGMESVDSYSMTSVPTEEKNSADEALDIAYGLSDEKEKASSSVQFVPPQIVHPNFIATSAASNANSDKVHKLMRTAQLKFKVKSVPEATQMIEDVILKSDGIILKSSIENQHSSSQKINLSEDSACVVHYNNLVASLDLRVPCGTLDSVLRQIAPLAILIDYRVVDAEDVTTKLMADDLRKARLNKKQGRVSSAIATRSGKLEDVMLAEKSLDQTLEEADQVKISEYNTNDKIAFSSIKIELYQSSLVVKEKVVRDEIDVKSFELGFGAKIQDALVGGFSFLGDIFILIITVWPLWILLIGGFFIYLKIRKRHNKD